MGAAVSQTSRSAPGHSDVPEFFRSLVTCEAAATGPVDTVAIRPIHSRNTPSPFVAVGFHLAQDHAVRARAWLRFLEGQFTGPGSAQEDLDEAWEIAERGPMPLFLADIHLTRARLFGTRRIEVRSQEPEARSIRGNRRKLISRRRRSSSTLAATTAAMPNSPTPNAPFSVGGIYFMRW